MHFVSKKREAELEAAEILKGPESLSGWSLTLEEALKWNETFTKTALKGYEEPCDTIEELSLSQKVLNRKLMEVNESVEKRVG